ncbi:Hsp20/alpha crystallin [Mactra antiquata]
MSWRIVPSLRRQAMVYDRHRDLFSDWFRCFDDGWRMMPLEESYRQLDRHMDRFRDQMNALSARPFQFEIESPFVTDSEGNRKLSIKVDCSQFKPEEIKVKTMDGILTIQAKRVEEGSNGKLYREFVRHFTLPENVDPMTMKSKITTDGHLHVEAPVPPIGDVPKEHVIPIEQLETPAESGENKKGAVLPL